MRFIILTLVLLIVGCSTNSTTKKISHTDGQKNLVFSDFDQLIIPLETNKIAKMIAIVQPEIEEQFKFSVANSILKTSKEYNIRPQILIALIDTESNFRATKISTTGDISIAQVNVDIWNKEFKRLKMPLLEKNKLKEPNQDYAILMMGKILSLLKHKYEKKDRRWYARYHSNTSKYKIEYLKRIEVRMKMLDSNLKSIIAYHD